MAVCFLLLVCAAAPSVLFEIFPEWAEKSNDKQTCRAGNWWSRGLDNTAILIRILWFAIVPVPLFFGVAHLLVWHPGYVSAGSTFGKFLSYMSQLSFSMIQGSGAVIVVAAAAFAGGLLKFGGTILDTILDVDNYLRTSPVDQTPRARIAERCTSLLRYVAAFRDEQGRPYRRLIIVGHSLGSLVTADLLRFLKTSASLPPTAETPSQPARIPAIDTSLDAYGFVPGQKREIPIYLFTMGSPIRPLLNRFFPHLYEWVAQRPDNSSPETELASALKDPYPITKDALPDPADMAVTGWCNAYRSGDYVGRFLWVGPWFERILKKNFTPQPITDARPATRAEMCIGIGAHTHYWDRTAPDVAHTLDALINDPSGIFPE